MKDPYWKTEEQRGLYAIEMPRRNLYSTDERHIYYTHCRWDELYQEKAILWIGLMPGIHPERSPIMERIHWNTIKSGFTSFYAANLFSFRVQHERLLPLAMENSSRANLHAIEAILKKRDAVQEVVIHWGDSVGLFQSQVIDILTMVMAYGHVPMCLGKIDECHPMSALYSMIGCEHHRFFTS